MTELSTHVGSGLTWDNVNKLIVNSSAGDVVGPGASNDNRIVRFDGGTGKLVQDSAVTIDDAGNISTAGTVDGVDVSALGALAVAGPASATDNRVARFDGTTGKLIQSSSATIDDSGNITAGTLNGIDIATISAFMPQVRILSSNTNSTSTTVASVAGLTFSSLVAGSYIYFFGLLASTAASTTGYKISTTFSGTMGTAGRGGIMPYVQGSTSDGLAYYHGTTTPASSVPFTNGLDAGPVIVVIAGSFVASTSGNFALQWGTEVSGSTATLNAGSYGFLLRAS